MTRFALLIFSIAITCKSFANAPSPVLKKFQGETSFVVETTVPGVTVEGKSSAFNQLQADIEDGPQGLALKNIKAQILAKTLKTGIDVRDEHMQKLIFEPLKNKDNTDINIVLEAKQINCLPDGTDSYSCKGEATINIGKASATIDDLLIKLTKDASSKYQGQVKLQLGLEKLGITPPSYMGVTVEDQVEVLVKFNDK